MLAGRDRRRRSAGTASRCSTRCPAAGAEIRGAACGGRWRLAGAAAPRHRARAAGRARAPRRRQLPRRLRLPGQAPARRAARPTPPRRGRTAPSPAASSPPPPSATASSRSSPRPTPAGSSRRAGRCRCRPGATILADAADGPGAARGRGGAFRARRHPAARPAASASSASSGARRRLAAVDAVFFEKDGRLLRLDVVRGSVLQLTGERATAHVAHMLPRLAAPERDARRAEAGLPAALRTASTRSRAPPRRSPPRFDAVLQAPDGALLAIGWLLDPLRRVERVLIKSTANLYARLDAGWCPLPRPDLDAGFAADPRFADLLDERDVMHGFIAHAPGAARPDRRRAGLSRAGARRRQLPVPAARPSRRSTAPSGCRRSCRRSRPPSRSSRASSRTIWRRSWPACRRRARRGAPRRRPPDPARPRHGRRARRRGGRARSAASPSCSRCWRCSPARPRPSALELALVDHARRSPRRSLERLGDAFALLRPARQPGDRLRARQRWPRQLDLGRRGDHGARGCSPGCRRRCRKAAGLARRG